MTTPFDDTSTGTTGSSRTPGRIDDVQGSGRDRGIGLPANREGLGGEANEGGREGRTGVKDRISEQAKSAARQAREKAGTAFSERKTEVAGQVSSVAEAVRTSTNQLRGSGHDQIAGITESIADQAERAANYLRDADLRSIRRDFEDLARRQPMIVIGGALVLGLLGARFLRSSERRESGSGFDDARFDDAGFEDAGYGGSYGGSASGEAGYRGAYDRGGFDATT
jgi:hypothetical protein